MAKQIAVAVIHGMGLQGNGKAKPSDQRSFSRKMYQKLSAEIGSEAMAKVAWREIYWQDILQEPQQTYFNKLDFGSTFSGLRKFVLFRLADAASYRKTGKGHNEVYDDIHGRVKTVLGELQEDVGKEAPLIVIAHSLGAHIMSNEIFSHWPYKMVNPPSGTEPKVPSSIGRKLPSVQNLGRLHRIFSFGCNIPIFTFAYQPEDLLPIRPPISRRFKPGAPPWWVNFYDKVDDLGYPLRPIGGQYETMVDEGQIEDQQITSGLSIPLISHAFAHNAYWTDRDVYRPIGRCIESLLEHQRLDAASE